MAEFEIFHIIYLVAISVISILFIVQSIRTRQRVPIKDVTFEDYFRAWCEHHDYETPIEEIKGPLRPYLKSFFIVGKWYARLGLSANKVSVLGLIWALWTLECWFLGSGWILLGTLFIILSGATDSIDGVVAYLTGTESKLGAYYDSILDKFGDILWVTGPLYFVLSNPIVLTAYSSFWITTITLVGLFATFLALIQEYCRARQQSLGLTETIPVIGERISRLCCVIIITASIGFSNFFTILNPSPSFINVNVWISNYIIPICFFSLLGLAIVSLIQINRHAMKHLK
ncbi:MAG: CDP-alcohol phosphatidyltransferase family protein [Candidatus Helarchaeota archaeon]